MFLFIFSSQLLSQLTLFLCPLGKSNPQRTILNLKEDKTTDHTGGIQLSGFFPHLNLSELILQPTIFY